MKPGGAGAFAATLLAALAGALVWKTLGLPLPWLVGALAGVALPRLLGAGLAAPPGARQAGQWVIGTKIGLYFTPAVAMLLAGHAGLICGMALASLALGVAGAAALVRLGLADGPTAFFAAMPGGASEMANLAAGRRAAVDRVAAAHALRVVLVVGLVPLGMVLAGSHGADLALPAAREVIWPHLPPMAAASLAGVLALSFLRVPNAWVLGSLAAVAALSSFALPVSGLPEWAAAGGQLLIGCSLGERFGPGFLRRAPSFLAAIAGLTLLFLAATALLALALASPGGSPAASLILAFAPGGIAEMAITASQLQLGVPLVVAAHVTRLVAIMLLAPWVCGAFCRIFPGRR